ncbi:MAG: carbonic anhydrase [Planctomycetota bacterium]
MPPFARPTLCSFLAAMTIGAADGGSAPDPSSAPPSAEVALRRLMAGNARFAAGESVHPHESADYRASLVNEQHPFATVLACSDSRVTPVLIFDQGVGDLFVIRVAGNVVDEDVAGSIEYAIDHLGTRLLIVMGHQNCGAVTAAYHAFVARDLSEREPHEIESLLMRIEPALENLDTSLPEEMKIASGIERNVRLAIRNLRRFPDVRRSVESGAVVIRGAIYDLRTGRVAMLPE